jgi:hypothetical protein
MNLELIKFFEKLEASSDFFQIPQMVITPKKTRARGAKFAISNSLNRFIVRNTDIRYISDRSIFWVFFAVRMIKVNEKIIPVKLMLREYIRIEKIAILRNGTATTHILRVPIMT